MKSPADIFTEAFNAGVKAVNGRNDSGACGFANVNIRPARGAFVNYLKQNNIGRKDSYLGGYTVPSYICSNFRGQSIDISEDACYAFAKVLQENGITARVHSRLD